MYYYESRPRWTIGVWWLLAMSAYYLLKGTPLTANINNTAALACIDIVGNVLLGFITAYPFWWIIERQTTAEKAERILRIQDDFILRNRFRIRLFAEHLREIRGLPRRSRYSDEDWIIDLESFDECILDGQQQQRLHELICRVQPIDVKDIELQFETIQHYRDLFSYKFNQLLDKMVVEFKRFDVSNESTETIQARGVQAYIQLSQSCDTLREQQQEDYPRQRFVRLNVI